MSTGAQSNFWIQLISTLISAGVLGLIIKYMLKRGLDRVFLGWEKYEEEKRKNIESKEADLTAWRKSVTMNFDSIKKSVDEMKIKMPIMVTMDQCNESHANMYDEINSQGNRITALETKVEDLRKK